MTTLPPLQTLRAFLAVSEAQSFTAAARQLGLTQTAVSHQISQLETWLGVRLLLRDRRGAALTSAGAELRPSVAAAIEKLETALGAVRQRGRRRALRISTTPEFGTQWLAPRLEDFRVRHPAVEISVTLEYRRARLDESAADVAIWLGSGGAGQQAEPLMLDEEFAVSAPDLAARLPKRQALLAAPLLRHDGARHTLLDWRRWHAQLFGAGGDDDALPSEDIDFEGGPSFDTFAEMLAACREGRGFALVRSSLVADDLASGSLVRCFVESIPSDLQYHLVIAPNQRGRAVVTLFREWILATAEVA